MSNNDNVQALLDGRLWNEFCESLKAAGNQILADDTPADPLTRAEGFRYLTRLLRLGLEKNVEFGDPWYPQFFSMSHETAKIGNDNPDNFYQNCAVDGRCTYRITGNVGTVDYLSIETKAGSYVGGGDMAPTGHIALGEIETDADGNFTLMVSATEQPGNWLPMSEQSDNILVRQTFRDRATERRAELRIECLDPRGSDQLDPAKFAAQLAGVTPFINGTAGLFRQWMAGFRDHANQLPPNDQAMCLRAGGDPSIFYHNTYWELAADQALLIEFTPPQVCRVWNLQVSNYWMESLDYRYHRICINRHNARYEADGSVRIVVSEGNPGAAWPNWLSTAGHICGSLLLRYVEAEDFPPISTRVVSLDELAALGSTK